MFLFFLRVAVSASCQEPCCPVHIMFFHCVTLLCYAPDVEQIKMMMMMMISSYSDKGWKLSTVKKVCSRVDQTGSAILRKPCSGRPATAFSFYG